MLVQDQHLYHSSYIYSHYSAHLLCPWITIDLIFWQSGDEKLLPCLGIEPTTLDLSSQSGACMYISLSLKSRLFLNDIQDYNGKPMTNYVLLSR